MVTDILMVILWCFAVYVCGNEDFRDVKDRERGAEVRLK